MSANPLQPKDYRKRDNFNVFEDNRVGQVFEQNPGKWRNVISVAGTTDFTGSNAGAGAMIITAATTGTASLIGGGTVDLSLLAVDTTYDFQLARVENSGAGIVYVLIA